jgi:glucose-6-phosphate isomerase
MWEKAKNAFDLVKDKSGAGNDFLGWVDLPVNYDKDEFKRIKVAAEKIKKNSEVLIIVGIGGSYLGARAAIEFIHSPLYNNLKKDTPDIYYLGNSISTDNFHDILTICENKDFSINVISKSGTTTEPAIVFRILRGMLEKKYSKEGAKDRIFVTTDKNGEKSKLKALADINGYETFIVPDDIGGRYSVLTAVGLLPIAVSGADIDAMMDGAKQAREEYYAKAFSEDNNCLKYAVLRNTLHQVKGESIEILATYEPALTMMNEWWKQLYGESEGKDKKGIFPASVVFTTDLHSLGQYIQDGVRIVFETVINIKKQKNEIIIPVDTAKTDGMDFVDNMALEEVNYKAFLGTILAHTDGGTPNIIIDIDDRSEKSCGELLYFFELACGISGYMLGVNPFNQPGVEDYKRNMFALLGNEKYAADKAKLEKRLNDMGIEI